TIPGVGLTAETNSLAGNPQRAINANVNGQSNQTVNTRIDGAQNAYPWLPANVAYVPPADAIETVNVSTNSFDAEQGMAGGAAVDSQGKPVIIYDPATGNAHGANKTQVSCNGVLNVICPSRFDSASAAMIKLLQAKIAQEFATSNNLNNWTGSGTALFNRNTADFKINYVPTSKTT